MTREREREMFSEESASLPGREPDREHNRGAVASCVPRALITRAALNEALSGGFAREPSRGGVTRTLEWERRSLFDSVNSDSAPIMERRRRQVN